MSEMDLTAMAAERHLFLQELLDYFDGSEHLSRLQALGDSVCALKARAIICFLLSARHAGQEV